MKNKNKSKLINLIYFIPAIFWMLVIFYFSSLTGSQSSEQSNPIVQSILLTLNLNNSFTHLLIILVRKSAHIFEYFILFLLLFFGFTRIEDLKNPVIISSVITIVYACLDEFHQFFIPNRSAEILDILIDCIGILIGILLIYLIKIIKKSF